MPRIAALLALASALLLAPAPAHATITPIETGTLDWGVKESFRGYITGPIAHGSVEVTGGASTNADGTFRFPLTGGSFDDETGATVAAFAGQVRFRGHDGQLDFTLSDVRVELAADGARVLADVTSAPYPAGGLPASYPDTGLVALDLAGVDPVVAGGTVTWSALPATLTATGAPAFGGFYTAGTGFDPVTLTYEGPGGRPLGEGWDAPGSPAFLAVAETGDLGGTYAVYPDIPHDLVHVVSATGVRSYDADTFELKAEHLRGDLAQFGNAFDPETSTLFVVDEANRILTFRYVFGGYATGEVPMPGARTLDYDPATGKLWALGTFAPAPTFQGNPTVTVAERDGAGWTVASYPPLDTGGRNVSAVRRGSTGVLIAAYGALLVGGAPQAQASATLADTGAALVATDIPGTVAPAPASGVSTGYGSPVAGPAGAVVLPEFTFGAPETRVLTIAPSEADPSGYAVAGEPLRIGPGLSTVALDRTDGSLYAIGSDRIVVHRDGAAVATLPFEGAVRVAGGDASFYVASNASGVLARFEQVGVSPAITGQPAGQSVRLAAADGSAEVTFTAAATGRPLPLARWQQRAPGATGWRDIPGATARSLTVTATAALSGTRYRAVFENLAGKLATDAATLAVAVVPPAVEAPPGAGPPPPGPPPPGPPPHTDPPPAAPPSAPLWRAVGKRVTVGRKGLATLATVRCVTGPCRISAPKRITVRLRGKRHRAAIVAPARLRAGERGRVRIRLPRAAVRALRGRTVAIRLRVGARTGEAAARLTVRVTLRRA